MRGDCGLSRKVLVLWWNHGMRWVNCARIWSPTGSRELGKIGSLPAIRLLVRNFAYRTVLVTWLLQNSTNGFPPVKKNRFAASISVTG